MSVCVLRRHPPLDEILADVLAENVHQEGGAAVGTTALRQLPPLLPVLPHQPRDGDRVARALGLLRQQSDIDKPGDGLETGARLSSQL